MADYQVNGVLQVVAVHPHVDPTKIAIAMINLNTEDQRKLIEMIATNQRARQEVCPGDESRNITPHQFVHRADCDSCSVCGREKGE